MSSFVLKIIACITMLIDHAGYIVYNGKGSYFNYIGRIAFPIFAYQISVGYAKTKNLKNYILRLLLFAIISEIPFSLFASIISNRKTLNIFFTLLLGLFAIIAYDKIKNKFIKIIPVLLLSFIGEFLQVDYGFFGVFLVFLFFVFRENKIIMSVSFILFVFCKYVLSFKSFDINVLMYLCNILPLVFILLYNKKQGLKLKYFLYIFYPVHLLILYLIFIF